MQLRNQKGFTLIEIAIVLTIVGLVIGGIWLAASTVMNNNKKSELNRQVIQTVQNVKSLFASQSSAAPATGFNNTVAINSGVVPSGMVAGTAFIRHAFTQTAPSATNGVVFSAPSGTSIRMQMTEIPQDACVDLASSLVTQGNFSKYGLLRVGAAAAGTTDIPQGSTIAAISGICAATNIMQIDFTVP